MNASDAIETPHEQDDPVSLPEGDTPGTDPLLTLHFDFGTAQLSRADRQALQDLLPDLTHRQLSIDGYTDDIGPPAFNDWLALRRAEFVKDHLVGLGLDPDRIHITGHGHCCYVQGNDTPQGRAANRRAEIRLNPMNNPQPNPENDDHA